MVRWLLLILSTSLYHLLCIHFIFSKSFLLNKMTQTSIACFMGCAVLGIEPTEEHPTSKNSGSEWCGSFVGLSEIGSGTFSLTYVTRFLETIKYFLFACVPNSLPHIISLLWNSHSSFLFLTLLMLPPIQPVLNFMSLILITHYLLGLLRCPWVWGQPWDHR